jgi:hypothetical protein
VTRVLARFLAGGLALFAAERAWIARAPGAAALGGGAAPAALAAASVSDDELLTREALARGLDRRDPVVERRLVDDLRFAGAAGDAAALAAEARGLGLLEADPVLRRRLVSRLLLEVAAEARAREPSDAELLAHLARHRERFAEPPRVRFAQALVSGEGAPAGFALAAEQGPKSERDLARSFGAGFAAAVFALPPGAAPARLRSAFGWHDVRVRERVPAALPDLASARNRVRADWLGAREREAVAELLARLREAARGDGA